MNSTQDILTFSRTLTRSNSSSFTDANALIFLNARYRTMIDGITGKVQDFFWTWGYGNLVANQSEYSFDSFTMQDATTRDVVSIDSISVKYKTANDPQKIEKIDFNALDDDLSNYANWGGNPFYFVRDNSVFFYPAPTESVTSGLTVYGNYRPLDLTISSSTTEIKTPKLYNRVLADGICADYWLSNGKPQDAQVFENRFYDGYQKMLSSLSVRDREIMGFVTSTNKYQ